MAERVQVCNKKPEAKRENRASQTQKAGLSQSISSPVEQILFLQRTIGNQAVGNLIKSGALQAKLRIGRPGDIYEQEADRVAERVMRMPDHASVPQSQVNSRSEGLSIQSARCDSEKDIHHSQSGVPPIVHQVLRSPGQPLDAAASTFMEPRFGHDFNQVRVHTNARATESVQGINALAYTVGNNIVFGRGQYAPGTTTGSRLLAHELTHVVQQEAGGSRSVHAKPAMDQPGSPFEREADFMAYAVKRSSPSPLRGHMGSTLPYREATELAECIRIMGEENRDYCRAEVLGEKPEPVEEAPKWTRKHTKGPRLLNGEEPSYQVWFDHILPPVPTGVKQIWQIVESTHTFLTDKCEVKTETGFRIDIVNIGTRQKIDDSWGWIRRDNPCFAMEESKANIGFDDQTSNLAEQTNVPATKQLAEDTLGKMTGPKGAYSGVYTFVKSRNCRDCPEKLKEIQEKNKAPNGEALKVEGVGSWKS
ncbi:MAG TPA: DUF4157 domain-containing protein [Candidatus Methanoperedens sp.]|nr:DUF4157 domain-containing protein [Candidatus Methanoperedens sp.]HLB71706.1 DUF4157 domain-containing protein [Candidatus Methanoperedens sp.]